jgi:hypothetical protein
MVLLSQFFQPDRIEPSKEGEIPASIAASIAAPMLSASEQDLALFASSAKAKNSKDENSSNNSSDKATFLSTEFADDDNDNDNERSCIYSAQSSARMSLSEIEEERRKIDMNNSVQLFNDKRNVNVLRFRKLAKANDPRKETRSLPEQQNSYRTSQNVVGRGNEGSHRHNAENVLHAVPAIKGELSRSKRMEGDAHEAAQGFVPKRAPLEDMTADIEEKPTFNGFYFAESLFGEVVPLAFIFFYLQKGFERGECFNSSRYYFPSPRFSGYLFPLLFLLYIITLVNPGVLLVYALNKDLLWSQGFDFLEINIFYLLVLLRSIVISIKYSFFTDEMYEAMHTPRWTRDQGNQEMLLAGWTHPRSYPGFMEEIVDEAAYSARINLKKLVFTLGHRVVTLESIVARIAYREIGRSEFSVFGKERGGSRISAFSGFFALIIGFTPFLLRAYYGLEPFGNCWQTYSIGVVTLVSNIFTASNNFAFIMASVLDCSRRRKAFELVSRLITRPGIKLSEFLHDDFYAERGKPPLPCKYDTLSSHAFCAEEENIFIDIREPGNMYSWMILRRVIRLLGTRYYSRCQIFLLLYISFSFLLTLILTSLFLSDITHYIFGLVQLFFVVVFYVSGFTLSAANAIGAQKRVNQDRLLLKREILDLEKEIIDYKQHIFHPQHEPVEIEWYTHQLELARDFMNTSDELIYFEEEKNEPVRIIGLRAEAKVVTSIIGVLAACLSIAYQGLQNSGRAYDGRGQYTELFADE